MEIPRRGRCAKTLRTSEWETGVLSVVPNMPKARPQKTASRHPHTMDVPELCLQARREGFRMESACWDLQVDNFLWVGGGEMAGRRRSRPSTPLTVIIHLRGLFRIKNYLNSRFQSEISNSSMVVPEFKIHTLERVWEGRSKSLKA